MTTESSVTANGRVTVPRQIRVRHLLHVRRNLLGY